MSQPRNVFLSYGRKDVYLQDATNAVEQAAHFPLVEKVYHRLNEVKASTGLTPWLDKYCLTHDREFTDSLNRAIESATYLLLFIGAHAIESEWCRREWQHALRHCVPIIPILLDGTWSDDKIKAAYPPRILNTDGIDPRRADGTFDEAYLIDRIVTAIRQPPEPLAVPLNVRKLPESYVERPHYVDALKRRLAVNGREPAQSTIVGITSEQEVAALQGIGGIGKTTLALALCHDCDVRRNFDHIFWLDVGPATIADDTPGLMRIIGGHFGDSPDLYSDPNPEMARQHGRVRLQTLLAGARTLIVLDDVWHEGVIEAFSLAGVDCRVLATTRNKVLVDDVQREAVAKLDEAEGLRLLAAVIDPRQPDPDALSESHRAIVVLLDGHALAVEIAGKWLKKYGQSRVEDYLARLRSSEATLFENLQLSKTDRNASLERSLELSYHDLETDDDRRRFRALGIFASGSTFSLAALDAVWELNDAFIEAQTLIDGGLLEMAAADGADDRTTHESSLQRYTLHPLLRAYARALLEREGELDAVFPCYADYYIAQAKQFETLPPEEWSALAVDLPDITAVGDALVERTATGTSGDMAHALAFAVNICPYLAQRREVRRAAWLEMGLNAARIADEGDRQGLFLSELGLMWDDLGEKRKALDYFEQALPLVRATENRRDESSVLNNIAGVWWSLGELRKAIDYLEQALVLDRSIGDRKGEATTLNSISGVLDLLGEPRKALEYLEQALIIRREVGDRKGEAATLSSFGAVWLALGDPHKALNYLEQALPIIREVGDRGSEAKVVHNIGTVWHALGEMHKTLNYLELALHIFREVGDRIGEAAALRNIGVGWHELGESRKALDYYEQALPLQRAVGDRHGEVATLSNIGWFYLQQGDLSRAAALFEQIIPIVQTMGVVAEEALFRTNFGGILAQMGRTTQAIAQVEAALALLRSRGLPQDAGGQTVPQIEAFLAQLRGA